MYTRDHFPSYLGHHGVTHTNKNVRERERQGDRERQRERESDRERDREIMGGREREREN